MPFIAAAGLSDVGRRRESNEDAFLVDDEHCLYLVADGMGGHQAGEVASAMVVDTFRDCLHNQPTAAVGLDDETLSAEANRLVGWIRCANHNVFQASMRDTQCRGMGSTLSAVWCTDSTIIAANVGDSPIYLVRDRNIELISVTHTLEAEQASLDPARIRLLGDRFKHMLSRAIGVDEHVEPDVCELPCLNGDGIILCSDGLSNMVAAQEMAGIIEHNEPAAACRMLVDLANARGGDDNITVIVLRIAQPATSKKSLAGFLSGLVRGLNGCF